MQEIYLNCAERLGHRAEGLARIIEYATSPRQVRIIMEMNQPPGPALTAEQLGEKLGFAPRTVQDDLEDLFRKGLAFPVNIEERREWRAPSTFMRVHDAMLSGWAVFPDRQRLFELWKRYDEQEGYEMIASLFKQFDMPPLMRVIPAWRSVLDDPNLQPWEDWREIFKGMDLISVVDCPCRLKVGACERPINVCMNFNRNAKYDIASGHGRKVSVEEALQIMDDASMAGLIGMVVPNARQMDHMCNCCSDCCYGLVPLKLHDISFDKSWSKSRYEAMVDQEQCSGCQRCLDNCNFEAIEMVSVTGTKKLKARVTPEKCFGCGACHMLCEPQAIAMACVRPVSHVPDTGFFPYE